MRTLRLAQVAAQAEGLVLKRTALRFGKRAAFGAVAGVFALALLVMLHVTGWIALNSLGGVTPFWSSVIVLGIDLLLAGLFGLLARGTLPDTVEREAMELRDRSLLELRNTALLGLALGPAGRVAGRSAFSVAKRMVGRKRR